MEERMFIVARWNENEGFELLDGEDYKQTYEGAIRHAKVMSDEFKEPFYVMEATPIKVVEIQTKCSIKDYNR